MTPTSLYKSQPPELGITTRPSVLGGFEVHELKGWSDLNYWARCNVPLWRQIQSRLGHANMSDIEKLQLLAGEMLRLLVEAQEREFARDQTDPDRYVLKPDGAIRAPKEEDNPPSRLKTFKAVHDTLFTVLRFDQNTAPDWLTSSNTVPGSTMDYRWFWNERVLTLKVGESVNTDFQTITRLS